MEFAIFFVSSMILGTLAIIASLLLTSKFMGGLDLGPLKTVLWKCALLLVATNLFFASVGYYSLGIIGEVAVWWLGYALVLRLDAKEARTAAFITFVMLVPVNFCSYYLAEHLTPEKNEPAEVER